MRFGRIATVVGIVIAIGTAFIAAGFNSIMDYIQALFSFFNAPLFATFIIAMFWRRATPWAGFWGLAAGTLAAVAVHFLHSRGPLDLGSPLSADFWGAVPPSWSTPSSPSRSAWSPNPNPTASCTGWSGG